MKITIDAGSVTYSENTKFHGFGMVSGNNSSRLLIDYKWEHPDKYQEILELIFGKSGLNITHLKLEMGSDVNSSSGTEPAILRRETETPDVARGAGFQLAADAKKIHPDLTLDMLWWSEPRWVTDSPDVYAARYFWYAQNLRAAYRAYGLKFDYVSANRNERAVDAEWIKYLSRRLKEETDCPYRFADIRLVAADEEARWDIAAKMLADDELFDAVDIVGTHYTSFCDDNVRALLARGKTVWFTEGCPPMSYSKGTSRFDGSGLTGINGVLDVADRIAAMFPRGGMTMYEFQPVVSAYYDGVTFCHKQLIGACDPWSGFYSVESGFPMALHFARFFRKGDYFVPSACLCDGRAGGDGHALVGTEHSFATVCGGGDYSTVIVNPSAVPKRYEVEVTGLANASAPVSVWETRGGEPFDRHYFQKVQMITPVPQNGAYVYSVTLAPHSLLTLSTREPSEGSLPAAFPQGPAAPSFSAAFPSPKERPILSLPYEDDFSYAAYPPDYLSSRGGAPRYTTDEGGAFEVCRRNGRNVLMQQITPELIAEEWGLTPPPVTNFGDDRWFNYRMSAEVLFAKSDAPEQNYAGVGVRYRLGSDGASGMNLRLYENGEWRLCKENEPVMTGRVAPADSAALCLEADGEVFRALIDGRQVCEYRPAVLQTAGRAALYSSYHKNAFADIKITPISPHAPYFIERFDDTDAVFTYSGDWTHELMSSFKNYRRTVSCGRQDAEVCLRFFGTGFALFGASDGRCRVLVTADGIPVRGGEPLPEAYFREAPIYRFGLEPKEHVVKLKVLEGVYRLDGAELLP